MAGSSVPRGVVGAYRPRWHIWWGCQAGPAMPHVHEVKAAAVAGLLLQTAGSDQQSVVGGRVGKVFNLG